MTTKKTLTMTTLLITQVTHHTSKTSDPLLASESKETTSYKRFIPQQPSENYSRPWKRTTTTPPPEKEAEIQDHPHRPHPKRPHPPVDKTVQYEKQRPLPWKRPQPSEPVTIEQQPLVVMETLPTQPRPLEGRRGIKIRRVRISTTTAPMTTTTMATTTLATSTIATTTPTTTTTTKPHPQQKHRHYTTITRSSPPPPPAPQPHPQIATYSTYEPHPQKLLSHRGRFSVPPKFTFNFDFNEGEGLEERLSWQPEKSSTTVVYKSSTTTTPTPVKENVAKEEKMENVAKENNFPNFTDFEIPEQPTEEQDEENYYDPPLPWQPSSGSYGNSATGWVGLDDYYPSESRINEQTSNFTFPAFKKSTAVLKTTDHTPSSSVFGSHGNGRLEVVKVRLTTTTTPTPTTTTAKQPQPSHRAPPPQNHKFTRFPLPKFNFNSPQQPNNHPQINHTPFSMATPQFQIPQQPQQQVPERTRIIFSGDWPHPQQQQPHPQQYPPYQPHPQKFTFNENAFPRQPDYQQQNNAQITPTHFLIENGQLIENHTPFEIKLQVAKETERIRNSAFKVEKGEEWEESVKGEEFNGHAMQQEGELWEEPGIQPIRQPVIQPIIEDHAPFRFQEANFEQRQQGTPLLQQQLFDNRHHGNMRNNHGNRFRVGGARQGRSAEVNGVENGFHAPEVVQRGFLPILPYSEVDPGVVVV